MGSVLFAALFSQPALAATIYVNGKAVAVENVKGVDFVPLVEFGRAVGEKVTNNTISGVTFEKENLFTTGKKEYKMLYAPYTKNDKLYVPLPTLLKVLDIVPVYTPRGLSVQTRGVIKTKDSSPVHIAVDRYEFRDEHVFVYPSGLIITSARNPVLFKSKMFIGIMKGGNGCFETPFPVSTARVNRSIHGYLHFREGFLKWSQVKQPGYKCGYQLTIIENGKRVKGSVVPDYDFVIVVI